LKFLLKIFPKLCLEVQAFKPRRVTKILRVIPLNLILALLKTVNLMEPNGRSAGKRNSEFYGNLKFITVRLKIPRS
jgi:hypothetical protein